MAKNAEDLEKLQKQLDQITKKFRELGKPSENPFNNFTADKLLENFKNVDKAAEALDGTLFKVKDRLNALNSSTDDLVKQMQAVLREISNSQSPLNQMNKSYKGLISSAQKLADESEQSTSMNSKDLAKLKDKAVLQQKYAQSNAEDLIKDLEYKAKQKDAQGKLIKLTKKEQMQKTSALGILNDTDNTQQAILDKIDERIKLEDKFNKKLGAGGQLASGLDKAMQKAGLPSIGISDSIEKAKKDFLSLSDEGRKSAGKFDVLKNVTKGIGKNLKGALTSVNLIQLASGILIKTLLEMDKSSGDFAKNNGISYKNAVAIRGEMSEIALHSDDLMVSSKGLMETQNTLNGYFGQSTKFTGKLADDMTSISVRTGLSAEAQGDLALESIKTGKGAKDILKSQTLTVREMNKEKGLQMSVKQVQEAVAKVSNSIYLTFKGSREELSKQVMSVKALGANMAQVEGIASSLLDFEGSIQSELEAELLLGKDINLEKARQAALEGDMGKVAEEVLENKAIMNAFETKNVIAQEAAAKALGMNRDQLAGMIKEQEKLEAVKKAGFSDMDAAQEAYNKMREDGLSKEEAAAEMKDKDLATQLESVSAAEKMNGVMAKFQEILVPIGESILYVLDLLDPVFSLVTGIAKGFAYLGDLSKAFGENITELTKGMGALGSLFRGLAYIAVLLAAYGAFLALSYIPIVGGVLGAAAAATIIGKGFGAISSTPKKAGDIMSPADGKTQVSTAEGGLFELSPNDDLVAAPGAAGAMTKKGEKGSEGGNAALISAVQQLISVNQKILAKSTIIEMNGNQVGEEINQSERAIQ